MRPFLLPIVLLAPFAACRPAPAPSSTPVASEAPVPRPAAAPAPAAPAPAGPAVVDASLPLVTVWKTPTCGCCHAWIEHMQAAGFRVEARDTLDLVPVKEALGVPGALASCHTARVGGYVVEGHVPAEDVKRLLAETPAGVAGIGVGGMPIGSPGMEVPGQPAQPYDVTAFGPNGQTVFASHR